MVFVLRNKALRKILWLEKSIGQKNSSQRWTCILSVPQTLQQLPNELYINIDHFSEKKVLTVLYVKLQARFCCKIPR